MKENHTLYHTPSTSYQFHIRADKNSQTSKTHHIKLNNTLNLPYFYTKNHNKDNINDTTSNNITLPILKSSNYTNYKINNIWVAIQKSHPKKINHKTDGIILNTGSIDHQTDTHTK